MSKGRECSYDFTWQSSPNSETDENLSDYFNLDTGKTQNELDSSTRYYSRYTNSEENYISRQSKLEESNLKTEIPISSELEEISRQSKLEESNLKTEIPISSKLKGDPMKHMARKYRSTLKLLNNRPKEVTYKSFSEFYFLNKGALKSPPKTKCDYKSLDAKANCTYNSYNRYYFQENFSSSIARESFEYFIDDYTKASLEPTNQNEKKLKGKRGGNKKGTGLKCNLTDCPSKECKHGELLRKKFAKWLVKRDQEV